LISTGFSPNLPESQREVADMVQKRKENQERKRGLTDMTSSLE
jgi:hypothetical protein